MNVCRCKEIHNRMMLFQPVTLDCGSNKMHRSWLAMEVGTEVPQVCVGSLSPISYLFYTTRRWLHFIAQVNGKYCSTITDLSNWVKLVSTEHRAPSMDKQDKPLSALHISPPPNRTQFEVAVCMGYLLLSIYVP